jgi:ribose/xylose/arabinose/galactoside ABC-type transport system permease subunit
VTAIPHKLHVYLLPFGTTAFLAGLAVALAAGFAAGLLFVAILLPPFIFFYCFNTFILCILNI